MKKKKVFIIVFSILSAILVCLISLYCIRAGTLLNGRTEETIIRSLSEDKENPIQILAVEKYDDYLAVLYKSPLDDDSCNDYAHFEYYEKSRYYKYHYEARGGNYGNFLQVNIRSIREEEFVDLQEADIVVPSTVKCFVYDIARDDTTCIIYETDAAGNDVRKIDEFKVLQTDFIMVKEYELLSSMHSLSCTDISHDYERSFNENYEKTDREQFELMQKEQKEAEEAYNNASWIDKIVNKLYRLRNRF